MYWQSNICERRHATHANNNMLDKWRTVERSFLAIAIRRACRWFSLDSPLLLSHTTGAFSHSTNKKISRNEIIGSIFFDLFSCCYQNELWGWLFFSCSISELCHEKEGASVSEDKNEAEWGAGEKFIFETITRCKHWST